MTRPLFHYDLDCPWSWLAAERISSAFANFDAPLPEWRPVASARLTGGGLTGASAADSRDEIALRAIELGLPEVRFPGDWPDETGSDFALRGALYAAEAGRVIAVSLAAFRQQFLAARSLAELDNFLIAAASCELHPRAVTKGIESQAIAERLEANQSEAASLGVERTPTVSIGSDLFTGEGAIEEAVLAAVEVAGVKD